MNRIFAGFLFCLLFVGYANAAIVCRPPIDLSTESCELDEELVLRLSTPSNAHAEDPSLGNYNTGICCKGDGFELTVAEGGNCAVLPATDKSVFVALTNQTNAHGYFVPTADQLRTNNVGNIDPAYPRYCLNPTDASFSVLCSGLPSNQEPINFGLNYAPTSCLFGISNNGSNGHFYACDDPILANPGFLKVYCSETQAAQQTTPAGDMFSVQIETLTGMTPTTVFDNAQGTQLTARITVTNTSQVAISPASTNLTVGFQSTSGDYIYPAILPITIPPLTAGALHTETLNFPLVGLNQGTYVIYASVPGFSSPPSFNETVLVNNSAQEFITIVPPAQQVSVPEHDLASVGLVVLSVLSLIMFSSKKIRN